MNLNLTHYKNESNFKEVQAAVQTNQLIPVDELTFNNYPIFNNQGNLNYTDGNDKRARVMAAINVVTDIGVNNILSSDQAAVYNPQGSRALLEASMREGENGPIAHRIKANMENVIRLALDRETIAPKIMNINSIGNGPVPQEFIDNNNAAAEYEYGNTKVNWREFKLEKFHPQEVDIKEAISIDARDIREMTIDPVRSCYKYLQTACATARDRILFDALEQLIDPYEAKNSVSFSDSHFGMTPQRFTIGTSYLDKSRYGLNCAVMTESTFRKIIVNEKFINLYSGFESFQVMRTGRLGTLCGISVVVDIARGTEVVVLDEDVVWFFAKPDKVGKCGDRGGPEIVPHYKANMEKNGIGFAIYDVFHATPINPYAIFKLSVNPINDLNWSQWAGAADAGVNMIGTGGYGFNG